MNRVAKSRLSVQLLCLVAVAPVACGDSPPNSGIDFTAMNMTVDPCQDFYQYACGGWISPVNPCSVW